MTSSLRSQLLTDIATAQVPAHLTQPYDIKHQANSLLGTMAPARRSSRKTDATNTPPLSTPRSQAARQTTLNFGTANTRQQSTPAVRPRNHLLDLPAEIRLLIYQQMFPCERVDIYAITGSLHKKENARYISGGHLAILRTCRTIYTEAKPVLYGNSEFCIHIQDYYWLHMWTRYHYEEVFDVEDFHEEPHPFQWRLRNPWLQDPRSIVPLDNVCVLTLAAECNMGETEHTYTWTGQIKQTLRAASNIQKLHIELRSPNGDELSQDATDLMLEHFANYIRCHGTVTAEMESALGAIEFDSGSYYKMLDRFKGQVLSRQY